MHTIENKYLGQLRIESTHLKSGNKIISDAPTDNNGKGEAFSPTDLVSSALGSCMLTIMGIKANNSKIDIEGARVNVTKIMSANPRKIEEIKVDFFMPKSNYSEKEKTVLERAAKTCPVALSLHPDLKQTITFNY